MSVPTLIDMFMQNTHCAVHNLIQRVEEARANMGTVPDGSDCHQ